MVNAAKIKLDYGVKKHLPRASYASERVSPSSIQAICASAVYVAMERRIFLEGWGEGGGEASHRIIFEGRGNKE